MSDEQLLTGNGCDDKDWPDVVKEDLLKLFQSADEQDFSMICAVGLNREAARQGEIRLSVFFSPRSSSNPHFGDMVKDLALLFRKMAERQSQ